MKHIATLFGGAIEVNEDQGKVSVAWDQSIGGGKAAGVVEGQGAVSFDVEKGVELAESEAIAKLPAALQPMAVVLVGIINPALKAIE